MSTSAATALENAIEAAGLTHLVQKYLAREKENSQHALVC